jgi:hypothetical protein
MEREGRGLGDERRERNILEIIEINILNLFKFIFFNYKYIKIEY